MTSLIRCYCFQQAISFSRITASDLNRLGIDITDADMPIKSVIEAGDSFMISKEFQNKRSNKAGEMPITYETGFDNFWKEFGTYLKTTIGYLLQYTGSKVCLLISTL